MTDHETQRRLAKLDALEAGGVDNWEFYGESLSEWRKENHVHECIDTAIEGIDDLLIEANIHEPAGLGCGYAVEYDQSKMRKLLSRLVTEANEGC